jgi:hypothetical protein
MNFSFRNNYNPEVDAYKYKVGIDIEKLRVNVNPIKIEEFMLQRWFCETQSYAMELKRYRPLVRI